MPLHIDFIKADGDGPEGVWLRSLDNLISTGQITLGGIVLEGNHLMPETMVRFQQAHGFEAFRIDQTAGNSGDKRR